MQRRIVGNNGRSVSRWLASLVAVAMAVGVVPAALAVPASAASANVAGQAQVTASSQNTSTSQTAVKAVDGSVAGYPTDHTREWATVRGRSGSWLQLTWAKPMSVERVVLYDRPNLNDRITAANLLLSNGTRLATGSLNNNGSATTVTFPAVAVSSVRLEITGVASATENIGLAEIEVWGAPAENRAPEAKVGADFSAPAGLPATLDGSASIDPDSDALTYAWAQTSGDVVTLSGATTAKASFTPASPGVRTFALTVSDPKGLSSTASVTVTVTENQPPTADAGADQSVHSGTLVRMDGRASTDPEQRPLTYTWAQVGSSPAPVTLSGSTTAQPTFTAGVLGKYTFRLVVGDGLLQSAADEVNVIVTEAPAVATNVAGTATVTASSANTGTSQTPDKAVDGQAVGYPADHTREWATTGGKAGSWLNLVWPSPIVVERVVLYDRPNANDRVTAGTLLFSDGTTVATGSLVNSGTATVLTIPARATTSLRLNITGVATSTENVGLAEIEVWGRPAVNRAPIADATDASGLAGESITLDGSRSADPDGNTLTYAWTQAADTAPRVTVGNADQAKATISPTTQGDYVFNLTVSDGKLQSADTATVRVGANTAPTADAGPDADALTGSTITLDGSASADPQGTALRYEWAQVGGTPAIVTLANPTGAKPTFTARTPGQYTFRLTVSDGVSTATDDVVITVAQAPNDAPIARAGDDQGVTSGTLVTLDGTGSSDPDGDTLTYAWALTGGTGITLTNPTSAKPTFSTTTTGTYTFTLTVDDGQASATDSVTVTVRSAGTLTVATSGANAVWTADVGVAHSRKSVQLQKQTIVTKMTTEVATASWVTIATATANTSGVARFTITDQLEVTHAYRAVIDPTSANPLLSDTVSHAAPRPTMSPTTGLATVHIDTNEGASITSKDIYWEGRMTMTAANRAAGTTSTACAASSELLVKVAGRGNYTWTLDKKPYKISLDKKANLCGMGEAKKWALIANHYDRSLLRNTTAMKMGLGMSNLAFTPDSVPVDVFVNGSYQGAYTLMERVNIGAGRVADGANELKDNDTGANDNPPNVSGTYLLEWDFRAGGDHNITVGESGTVAINEPEDEDDGSGITPAQIAYISDYVNDADQMVFDDGFNDPVNGWRKYIDEKSLIDWYIVQELTKNLDANLYTSVFMYKTRDTATVPGKLYFGPIWDFDTSMGAATYPGNQGTTSGWYLRNELDIDAKMTPETWINRLFADPVFAANVKSRWREVYPILTQSDSFVAAQSTAIAGSANANFAEWDINERLEDVQVIKGSWQGEVTYLRDWLKARIAWMNSQLG